MASLSPGTTVARYRIIKKIGAGGMGEVYRAQDKELGRPVALKFLSGELATQQSRLKRFIQEAKAASALNHPNILTVHEIGRVEEDTFIATEFVEGVTLRRLMREPLKLPQVLDIAIQISSALVAAHSAGIVHRDIKPENIMIRSDGIVKVLDFGLAKLTDRQDSLAGSEASTVALVHTEPGAILGTVAYMSPEQAAGRDVDARSDIWSLGVVLYEMISGRAPFEGVSKSHIIVSILDQEPPPITQFAPEAPQPIEWLIAEALTKDPEERCQTAKEMLSKLKRLRQRVESGTLQPSISDYQRSTPSQFSEAPVMDSIRTAPSASRMTQPEAGVERSTAPSGELAATAALSDVSLTPPVKRSRSLIIAGVLGLVILGAVGYALYSSLTRPREFAPTKMTALTTGGKISGEDINGQVSISPDGRYVVCAANDLKQQASLWIRQIATNSLVRLVPPENGRYLSTTFSPDGEFIYYVASLEKTNFVPTLYRIPVLGGTPTKVLDRVFSPVAFSRDGTRFVFVRSNQEEMALMVANTDGSEEPRNIAVSKPPNGFSTSGPSWSADAKRIACGMFNATTGQATVVEVPVGGGDPQPIGSERWASVGRVIWLTDGSGLIMTAQPEFSSIGTQIWFLPYPSGQARKITNDLNAYGEVSLGMTEDSGTIASIQIVNTSGIWITAPNEDETRSRPILKSSLPESVAWTPDGKIVYAIRTGENWDIWISNRDGSESRQLTADTFVDQQPAVSADGRYIVFQSNRAGDRNLWRIDIDGSNPKQITRGSFADSFPVSSADGQFVIFTSDRAGSSTIWKVPIDGGSPVQMTSGPGQLPSVSPDGKLVAYFFAAEQAKNQPRLGIIPFEGGEPVKTLDLPLSVQPIAFAWMPDGRSIAFLDNSSGILNVWTLPIEGGAPNQLTNFKSEFINSFAISKDGKIATYRFSGTRDIVLIKGFR